MSGKKVVVLSSSPRRGGKEFYFIVAAADSSKRAMERTLEEFRAFTSCLSKGEEKGIIYGTGAWNRGDIKGKPAMKEAYELGNSL